MNAISVLIADDHTLFREGIKSILKEETDIKVEIEAGSGEEIMEKLEKQNIDIILMDIDMPQMDGVMATRKVKEKFPATKVLILSGYNDLKYILEVMRAGASGYLVKDAENLDLANAIKTLAQGNAYYSQSIAGKLSEYLRELQIKSTFPSLDVSLTNREKEILQLIAREFTNQEIADQLFISTNTVFTHRKNLLKKFNARNTAGLIKYAAEYGLL